MMMMMMMMMMMLMIKLRWPKNKIIFGTDILIVY